MINTNTMAHEFGRCLVNALIAEKSFRVSRKLLEAADSSDSASVQEHSIILNLKVDETLALSLDEFSDRYVMPAIAALADRIRKKAAGKTVTFISYPAPHRPTLSWHRVSMEDPAVPAFSCMVIRENENELMLSTLIRVTE